jgi:long-chain acyl-CoA synthetase
MTELFRPISYRGDEDDDRPDAIGRVVPGVRVRLVTDEGRDAQPGEEGELWIRSPGAMTEYLDAPEETRAVLDDGWFRTGDLAIATEDGFVTISGRKRERILRGGHSVFPGEVEMVLQEHPAVAEAAVAGIPHAELGEEVAAFVVLREGSDAAETELITWCRERLATFKYPRRVTIMPSLPKSSTGKVLKRQLVSANRPRTTS